jgi:hypothetical protein
VCSGSTLASGSIFVRHSEAPSLHPIVPLMCPIFGHEVRDTVGTGLYFLEYDAARALFGRRPSGEQGPQPRWMPFRIHESILPFTCGSLAGVTSWALIYPLDVVKTKVSTP